LKNKNVTCELFWCYLFSSPQNKKDPFTANAVWHLSSNWRTLCSVLVLAVIVIISNPIAFSTFRSCSAHQTLHPSNVFVWFSVKATTTTMRFLSLIYALSLFTAIAAAPEEDRIVELPLFGIPPTPQYSGYLDGTDGCDTTANGDFCKVHYWYASAATELMDDDDDDDAPVVLWLNGGPGSSSILGLLQENGPLLINSFGGLMENPCECNALCHAICHSLVIHTQRPLISCSQQNCL
jgi:hypothetical protein